MKNKGKIGIVIDSTTILDKKVIEDYGIKIVSLNVQTSKFVKKETETTDLEIINELDDVKSLRTSSPSPAEFVEAYESLFKEGYEYIVCYILSKELSSTYQSAVIGKSYMDNGEKITVFDTNLANFGIANLVESMLSYFEKDTDIDFIIKESEERIKNSQLEFTVLDLKHLVNGGRLSKLGGLVGTILHIKPMVRMNDGKLEVFKKERNINTVLNVFLEVIKSFGGMFKKVFVKVVDLMQDALAEKFVAIIKDECNNVTVTRIRTVGPSFFIHLGNNGIGITVTATNNEN